MSGIYIPGMEMPTVRDTLVLVRTNGTAIVYEDEAYATTVVPVPEHGRLIDADALFDKHFGKEYVKKAMAASKEEMGTALINIPLVINNAPTIIPASEEEHP